MHMISNHFKVLDIRIDALQIPDVTSTVEGWILSRKTYGNYICVTNVSTITEAQKDNFLKEAINNSTLSVCDGMPLVWLGRLKGFNLRRRVYGPELMDEFLKISNDKGYKNYFYGATDFTCQRLISRLKDRYKNLNVSGYYAPPFRPLAPEEKTEIIDRISSVETDILWVAIGSPKQERWMYEFKDHLKVPAIVGVGAAFDFLSGTKIQAPKWVQESGFEWLFRLAAEPKRLWKRYLINNTLFVLKLIKDFSRKRLIKTKDPAK